MANEFIAKNGLICLGNLTVSGSVISGSQITASAGAFTTASWAQNAISSGFAIFATSTSFAQSASNAISAAWAPGGQQGSATTSSWASSSLSSSVIFVSESFANINYPMVFSQGSASTVPLLTDNVPDFFFNPSTHTLVSPIFSASQVTASGGFFGTASNAISAAFAPGGTVAATSSWATSASWAQSSSWASSSFTYSESLWSQQFLVTSSFGTASNTLLGVTKSLFAPLQVGNKIYFYGGGSGPSVSTNFGTNCSNDIWTCSINSPLVLGDSLKKLPTNLLINPTNIQNISGTLYIFGGETINDVGGSSFCTSSILTASALDPTTWGLAGNLPGPLGGHQIFFSGSTLWAIFGQTGSVDAIAGGFTVGGTFSGSFFASVANPLSWSIGGNTNTLTASANNWRGQMINVNNTLYLYGGYNAFSSSTVQQKPSYQIFSASLATPTLWAPATGSVNSASCIQTIVDNYSLVAVGDYIYILPRGTVGITSASGSSPQCFAFSASSPLKGAAIGDLIGGSQTGIFANGKIGSVAIISPTSLNSASANVIVYGGRCTFTAGSTIWTGSISSSISGNVLVNRYTAFNPLKIASPVNPAITYNVVVSQSILANTASFALQAATASWLLESVTATNAFNAVSASSVQGQLYQLQQKLQFLPTFSSANASMPAPAAYVNPVQIGSTIYFYGGMNASFAVTNRIWSASVTTPLIVGDTGKVLPMSVIYQPSNIQVIGNTVYFFGGELQPAGANQTIYPTSSIMTASLADPTTVGFANANLPVALGGHNIKIIGTTIYTFFGQTGSYSGALLSATSASYTASTASPLVWGLATNTLGNTASVLNYRGQIIQIGDTMYLYGGKIRTISTPSVKLVTNTDVFTASVNAPLQWGVGGSNLPAQTDAWTLISIGNTHYLMGGGGANDTASMQTAWAISASTPFTPIKIGDIMPLSSVEWTNAVIPTSPGPNGFPLVLIYGGWDGVGTATATIFSASITGSSVITSDFLPDYSSNLLLKEATSSIVYSLVTASIALTASFAAKAATASLLVSNLSASVPSYQPGLMFYDTASATFAFYGDNSGSTLNIGQEDWIRVYNSGTLNSQYINNGAAIYLSGSTGNIPNAWLAIADGTFTKHNVAGVATVNITTQSVGYITAFGKVNSVAMVLQSGSQLWLSNTVSGGLQSTVPTSSSEKVLVGMVLASGSTGTILVDINPFCFGCLTASFAISASFASASLTSSFFIVTSSTVASTASYIAAVNVDRVFFFHEAWDFIQTTTASGQIDGAWSYNTGTLKTGNPEFNHPGILWLSASQIRDQVNTFTNFGPANVPSASIQLGNVASSSFVLAVTSGSYQYAVRLGYFDNITTELPPNGIYFEKTGSPIGTFNTASAQLNNWICVVRTGSIQLSATSSVSSTASLAWNKFTIATSGNPALGTTASFYINGTVVGTITSSLTGSLPIIYGIQHVEKQTATTTGSALSLKLDYIEIEGSCIR